MSMCGGLVFIGHSSAHISHIAAHDGHYPGSLVSCKGIRINCAPQTYAGRGPLLSSSFCPSRDDSCFLPTGTSEQLGVTGSSE
ncbi:hypothetical protein EYF80_014744 [Liparis tanakae]|uniref:Uncharacterized protein n=1 Tax=Liparis tanakae TaxID=230148 RepID=A0A4Z2IAI0_9TELE|nr:hypothetical protein EYF80_014744 [Liparis tanakae]